MKTLSLQLSVQELQLVIRALGNLPYVQVQECIGKIQQQATLQIQGIDKTGEAGDRGASRKDNKEAGRAAQEIINNNTIS